MSELGYKISELDVIPLTGKDCDFPGRIAIDNTYFMGYAQTVFGTRYNTHNYQIPLSALRKDFVGYIGIETLNSKWATPSKIWTGKWEDTNVNTSYIKVWKHEEYNHPYYNKNKFSDLDNSYYIIQDLPFPFEEGSNSNRNKGEKPATVTPNNINNSINVPILASDPYPNSHKIPTKSYIDERLASKRLVEVSPDFWVRDYDCVYVIRAEDITKSNKIKIHYPEKFAERILHNQIKFTILVEGVESGNKWLSAVSNKTIPWEIYDGDTLLSGKLTWLNGAALEIEKVIGKDSYYGDARYLKFNLETVTNRNDIVQSAPITIDGRDIPTEKVVPDYCIYITCENLLYDLAETNIRITSADSNKLSVSGNSSDGFVLTNNVHVKHPDNNNKQVTVTKNGGTYTVAGNLKPGNGITIDGNIISLNTSVLPEQVTYSQGEGIIINNNTISLDKTAIPSYKEGSNITISDDYTISAIIPPVPETSINGDGKYISVNNGTRTISFIESKLYDTIQSINSGTTLTIHELDNKIYYSTIARMSLWRIIKYFTPSTSSSVPEYLPYNTVSLTFTTISSSLVPFPTAVTIPFRGFSFAESGIITGQAFGIAEDGETFHCADFHRVKYDMSLANYNDQFPYNDGRCPFGRRGKFTLAFVLYPDENLKALIFDSIYNDYKIYL